MIKATKSNFLEWIVESNPQKFGLRLRNQLSLSRKLHFVALNALERICLSDEGF